MAIKQFIIAGDSLTQGTTYTVGYAQGGNGAWWELVADKIANMPGIGPRISSGIRGQWLGKVGTNPSEWTYAGTWSSVVNTDAWDKLPYGGTDTSNFNQYGNGSSSIATWTKTSTMPSNVGFQLYWVDYTNGGNWQYRIDGGRWQNVVGTGVTALAHDNSLNVFYIGTPITSSLDIRGYDGSSNVGTFPAGIELFYYPPSTSQGIIFHNIAVNGSRLHELVRKTSGDRMAIFDSVKAGLGSPLVPTPTAGILQMNINDVQLANVTQWGGDIDLLYQRVGRLAPMAFLSPWNVSYNDAQQVLYTAKTLARATANGCISHDLNADWTQNGWSDDVASQAAGMLGDNLHETQRGHLDIQDRVFQWLRTTMFSHQSLDDAFTVGSSKVGLDDTLGGNTAFQVDREASQYSDATGIQVV